MFVRALLNYSKPNGVDYGIIRVRSANIWWATAGSGGGNRVRVKVEAEEDPPEMRAYPWRFFVGASDLLMAVNNEKAVSEMALRHLKEIGLF